MPLSISIVVGMDGRSRRTGFGAVGGETTEDYEWILRQLLAANDGLSPYTIIVGEDLAMEAACANLIRDTILINCIWHIGYQNLNKEPPWRTRQRVGCLSFCALDDAKHAYKRRF